MATAAASPRRAVSAIDPRGSVLVADPGDERIVRLWGDGTFLGELGGPGGRSAARS